MLDIGEERWEFVRQQVEALMASADVHSITLSIYYFATRDDIDVSTLAVSSQIARELRKRERKGEILSREGKQFIEGYDRNRREGRSIDLRPPSEGVQGPMSFSAHIPFFVKP